MRQAGWLAMMAAVLGFAGCSDNPSRPTYSFVVSPAEANVAAAQSVTFKVAEMMGTVPPGVTWSLSGPSCGGASCGTLTNVTSTSTDYVAPANIPAAMRVTLRATATDDGGFAEAAIAAYKPGVIAVRISPTTLDMTNKQTAQFIATVENDPTAGFVKWSVSGHCGSLSDPTCGSISPSTTSSSQTVTFTPARLTFAGVYDVTITATSSVDPTATASAKVKLACSVNCIP